MNFKHTAGIALMTTAASSQAQEVLVNEHFFDANLNH